MKVFLAAVNAKYIHSNILGKSQQIEDIKQNDGYFYHVTKIEGEYKIVYWDRRRTEMLIQEAIN